MKIIYEDGQILVVDKPPGLVVDTSETQKGNTLVDFLSSHYDTLVYHSEDARLRRGVVHRLDKDTSGVIVIAKTQTSFDILQKQFKDREVKKQYLALVHGLVEKEGVVEGSIGRNPGNREKFMVLDEVRLRQGYVGQGKEAVTEYKPVERLQFTINNLQLIFNDYNKIQMRKLERMNYNQFTMLRCFPATGRTHQIRVHLKYIGHPIISDEKYVGRKMYRLDKRWCPRQFLHAARLGFKHPGSGQWMELESELPEDLREALDMLTVDDRK